MIKGPFEESWEKEAFNELHPNGKKSIFAPVENWHSPTEDLDNDLEQAGFSYSSKFAKEYKYPNNMSAKDYEHYISDKFDFYVRYEVENFQPKEFWDKYGDKIKRRMPMRKAQINKEIDALISLNPELASIERPAKSIFEGLDIITGATSKFPVEDIKYFVEVHRPIINKEDELRDTVYDKEIEDFGNKIYQEIGAFPGYVMSPMSRKKLENIISNGKKQTNPYTKPTREK